MSNKLQALVWAHKMSHTQKTIMLALADAGADDGTNIYPSFAYLSYKTEYSVRQVMRVVKELRKLGAVKRIKRGNSHKRANEYRLEFSVFERKLPWKGTSDKMSLLDGQLVTSVTPTSDKSGSTSDIAMSHQSSSETPYKHKKRARVIPEDSGASKRQRERAIADAIIDLRLTSYARHPQTLAMRANVSVAEVEAYLSAQLQKVGAR